MSNAETLIKVLELEVTITQLVESHAHLKSLLKECQSVLEFYEDKKNYSYRPRFPDTKQMEISFDRGTKAREMLGKLEKL